MEYRVLGEKKGIPLPVNPRPVSSSWYSLNIDFNAALMGSLHTALQDTFLPVGYPDSVREEYADYQFWDSLQALASYLRNVLTAKATLQGVGVGDADASALAAALLWIVKDGIGISGSLLFAWSCSQVALNLNPFHILTLTLKNLTL
jgi:hypothetical protein